MRVTQVYVNSNGEDQYIFRHCYWSINGQINVCLTRVCKHMIFSVSRCGIALGRFSPTFPFRLFIYQKAYLGF